MGELFDVGSRQRIGMVREAQRRLTAMSGAVDGEILPRVQQADTLDSIDIFESLSNKLGDEFARITELQ